MDTPSSFSRAGSVRLHRKFPQDVVEVGLGLACHPG